MKITVPGGPCRRPRAPPAFMKTIVRHYRIDRREIAFLRFTVEAYDGAAVLTTVDPGQGVVRLHIAPGCLSLIESLVASLAGQILMVPVAAPERTRQRTR